MDIKHDIYDPKIVYKTLTAKRPSELDLFNSYFDQKCQDQLNKYSNQQELKLQIDRLGINLAIEMKNRNRTLAECKIIESIYGYEEIRKKLDQDIIMTCFPIKYDRNYIQFEHQQLQTCAIAKDSIYTISNISSIYEQNNVFPINRKNFNDQILEFINKKNLEDLYNCNMNKINFKEEKWEQELKLITQALNNDCNLAETCFSMTHFSKKWQKLKVLSLNSSYAMANIENKMDYNLDINYAENIFDEQYHCHVEQVQFSQDGKSFYFMYGDIIWIGKLDSGYCEQFMSERFYNSKFYLSYDNKFIIITQFSKYQIIYYDIKIKQQSYPVIQNIQNISNIVQTRYDLILSKDQNLFCIKTDYLQVCRIKYNKIDQLHIINKISHSEFSDQCLYYHNHDSHYVSMINLENYEYELKDNCVGPKHQFDKIYFIVKKVQINSIFDLILISSDYQDIYIYSLKFKQQIGYDNLSQSQIQYWHFLCQLEEDNKIYIIIVVKKKLQVICIPVNRITDNISPNSTFQTTFQRRIIMQMHMENQMQTFHQKTQFIYNEGAKIICEHEYQDEYKNIRSINASPLNKLIIFIRQNDEIQIQDYNDNQLKILKKINQFRSWEFI